MARGHHGEGEHARGEEVDGSSDARRVAAARRPSEKNTSSSSGMPRLTQQLLAVAEAERQLGAGLGGEGPHRPAPRRERRPRRPPPSAARSAATAASASAALRVRRRNTSSRRWRPARRSARGRSCSASQAVRAATVVGRGGGGHAVLAGARLGARRRRGGRRGRRRRGRPGRRSGSRRPSAAGHQLGRACRRRARWPWSMMTTRSASFSASSRSWVVSSTAHAVGAAGRRTMRRMSWRPATSMPGGGLVEEGDLGRPTRARASDRRCCSPPDSRRQVERLRSARPDPLEQLVGVGRVVVVAGEEAQHLGRADAGVDAAVLQHHADRGRPARRARSTGSRPSTRTVPAVGAAVALEGLDGGGLAGAVGAEQGGDLARAAAVNESAVDGDVVAVADRQVGDLDGRGIPDGRRSSRGQSTESGRLPGRRARRFRPVIDVRRIRTDPDAVRAGPRPSRRRHRRRSTGSSSSTSGPRSSPPSATTCGPGSTPSRRRSAPCAATAMPPRPRPCRPRAGSWARPRRRWPPRPTQLAAELRELLLRIPNLPVARRARRRRRGRQPGRRGSWACDARRPTPSTSGCRTGRSAPSSASSTSSGP